MTRLSYMIERDIYQSHIPELAKLLRGFDESAYRLELNGKVMSKSSWDVVGFDGFDLLGEAPSQATLHVQVLQGDSSIQVGDGGGLPSGDGDDGPISSPAAQPGATECSVTSPLYVKDGEKIYNLYCCLTKTTMSELFSEVLEKMVKIDPSESRRFRLRIGSTDFGLNERSKTTTLDMAGCIKEMTIPILFLPPQASAISSTAAQPEPDMRTTSELFVRFEEKLIRLHVCASHDTISDLFGKVFEKLDYLPSPSRIFYLRIGVRFWKQMGGKSLKQGEYWKQEDAGSMTTTLSEAGCNGQEGLTLQAHEVSVVLIPLSIKVPGDSLLVDVHLQHTSLVGLAGLVQEHVGEPVVHFIFGTDILDPSVEYFPVIVSDI